MTQIAMSMQMIEILMEIVISRMLAATMMLIAVCINADNMLIANVSNSNVSNDSNVNIRLCS